jgi:hypothetical protein
LVWLIWLRVGPHGKAPLAVRLVAWLTKELKV